MLVSRATLVYPKGMNPKVVEGAMHGLCFFSKFGLQVDKVEVSKGEILTDLIRLRSVPNPLAVRSAALNKTEILLDSPPGVFLDGVFSSSLPVVLTDARIFFNSGPTEVSTLTGFGGVILSVPTAGEIVVPPSGIPEKHLDLTVIREVAGIFGAERGHNSDLRCVMPSSNSDINLMIFRNSIKSDETPSEHALCRDCIGKVNKKITEGVQSFA